MKYDKSNVKQTIFSTLHLICDMFQLKHLIIFTLIAPVMLETYNLETSFHTNEKIKFHPEIDDVFTNEIMINVNGNLSSCTETHKGEIKTNFVLFIYS